VQAERGEVERVGVEVEEAASGGLDTGVLVLVSVCIMSMPDEGCMV
jgi:hypothetical protein